MRSLWIWGGLSRDGGAWWAAVYGVTQSWTQLQQLSSSSTTLFLDEKTEAQNG